MISGYAIRPSRDLRGLPQRETSMRQVYLLNHLLGSFTSRQASWIGHRCVSINDNPATDGQWEGKDRLIKQGLRAVLGIEWLSKLVRNNEFLSILIVYLIQMYIIKTSGQRDCPKRYLTLMLPHLHPKKTSNILKLVFFWGSPFLHICFTLGKKCPSLEELYKDM